MMVTQGRTSGEGVMGTGPGVGPAPCPSSAAGSAEALRILAAGQGTGLMPQSEMPGACRQPGEALLGGGPLTKDSQGQGTHQSQMQGRSLPSLQSFPPPRTSVSPAGQRTVSKGTCGSEALRGRVTRRSPKAQRSEPLGMSSLQPTLPFLPASLKNQYVAESCANHKYSYFQSHQE